MTNLQSVTVSPFSIDQNSISSYFASYLASCSPSGPSKWAIAADGVAWSHDWGSQLGFSYSSLVNDIVG